MSGAALATLAALALAAIPGASRASAPGRPIRVLVIVGGHDYERDPFAAMWAALPGVEWTLAEHPDAHRLLAPGEAARFDVITFYDLWQKIDDASKRNMLGLTRAGKGLVFLHHALGGYEDWPEYARLVGGRWSSRTRVVYGKAKAPSTYQHDVRMKLVVANPRHPVTAGVGPFELVDETYGGFDVDHDVRPLLTTDEASSERVVAWEHTVGRSRVVYLQAGHDHVAYASPSYRRLLLQAICWAARRRAP